MINKTYEKIKKFIQTNYKNILFLIFIFLFFNIRLPYYITTSGGLIDIENRIEIKDNKDIKGSFNLAYVNELQATIPLMIISKFNNNWEVYKTSELTMDEEEIDDVYLRDSLMLKSANNLAIKQAFTKASKEVEIVENKLFITYIDKLANTDLKIGDQIIKADNTKIKNKEQLLEFIKNKGENKTINFEVINNNKKYNRVATTFKKDNEIYVGIMIVDIETLKTNPKIEFKFKDSESGSSGGLMMSLAVYNHLVDKDITKGRKIVGTGTIDELGNVGSIGGVKYKLMGAVKEKADIFLVPYGENYDEVKKLKKEKNYKIKIVPVKTFSEAVEYLENN